MKKQESHYPESLERSSWIFASLCGVQGYRVIYIHALSCFCFCFSLCVSGEILSEAKHSAQSQRPGRGSLEWVGPLRSR